MTDQPPVNESANASDTSSRNKITTTTSENLLCLPLNQSSPFGFHSYAGDIELLRLRLRFIGNQQHLLRLQSKPQSSRDQQRDDCSPWPLPPPPPPPKSNSGERANTIGSFILQFNGNSDNNNNNKTTRRRGQSRWILKREKTISLRGPTTTAAAEADQDDNSGGAGRNLSGLKLRAVSSSDSEWRTIASQLGVGIGPDVGGGGKPDSGNGCWMMKSKRATHWRDVVSNSNRSVVTSDSLVDGGGDKLASPNMRSPARKLQSLSKQPDNLSAKSVTSANQQMMMMMMEENDNRSAATATASCLSGAYCCRRPGQDCDKKIICGREQAQLHSDWYLDAWLPNGASYNTDRLATICGQYDEDGTVNGFNRSLTADARNCLLSKDTDDDDDDDPEDLVGLLLDLQQRHRQQMADLPAPSPTKQQQQIQSSEASPVAATATTAAAAAANQFVELIYIVMETFLEKHNSGDRFSSRTRRRRGGQLDPGNGNNGGANNAAGCVIAAEASSEFAAGATTIATTTTTETPQPSSSSSSLSPAVESAPISDLSADMGDSKVRLAAVARPERNNDDDDDDGNAVGSSNNSDHRLQQESLSAGVGVGVVLSSANKRQLQQEEGKRGSLAANQLVEQQNGTFSSSSDDDDGGGGGGDYDWRDDDETTVRGGAGLNCHADANRDWRRQGQGQPLVSGASRSYSGPILLAVIAIDKLNRFIQLKPDLNELIPIHSTAATATDQRRRASKQPHRDCGFTSSPLTSFDGSSHAATRFGSRATTNHLMGCHYRLEFVSGNQSNSSHEIDDNHDERVKLDQQLLMIRHKLLAPLSFDRRRVAGFLSPICGSVFVSLQLELRFAQQFPNDCQNLYVKYRIFFQDPSGKWALGRKFTNSNSDGTKSQQRKVSQPAGGDFNHQIKPCQSIEKPNDAGDDRTLTSAKFGATRPNSANNRSAVAADADDRNSADGNGGNDDDDDDDVNDHRRDTSSRLLLEGSTITCKPNSVGLFHFSSADELLFELVPLQRLTNQPAAANNDRMSESSPAEDNIGGERDRGKSSDGSKELIGQDTDIVAADQQPADQGETATKSDQTKTTLQDRVHRRQVAENTAVDLGAARGQILILFEFYSSDFYADKPQGWSHLCIPLGDITESSITSKGSTCRRCRLQRQRRANNSIHDSSLGNNNDDDKSGGSNNNNNNTSSSGCACLITTKSCSGNDNWCKSTKNCTRRRGKQNLNKLLMLQVVRPKLYTLLDRLGYYLIGQLPDAMPSINEFVESNNRYMLQTCQTGQLALSYAINRQHSDSQLDSALRDLVTTDRVHHLSSPALNNQTPSSTTTTTPGHGQRMALNSEQQQRQIDLDYVVDAYRRAKDRIERLTVSVH